jgi:hypothetical protein
VSFVASSSENELVQHGTRRLMQSARPIAFSSLRRRENSAHKVRDPLRQGGIATQIMILVSDMSCVPQILLARTRGFVKDDKKVGWIESRNLTPIKKETNG